MFINMNDFAGLGAYRQPEMRRLLVPYQLPPGYRDGSFPVPPPPPRQPAFDNRMPLLNVSNWTPYGPFFPPPGTTIETF